MCPVEFGRETCAAEFDRNPDYENMVSMTIYAAGYQPIALSRSMYSRKM
jgi:hypothetical protein